MTLGIESGSPRILRKIKKSLSTEFLEIQLKKIKRYGFYSQGFFIVGFPYEKKEDIEATIKFAQKIDLDAAFFGTYVPLPGSSDFQELRKNKKIKLDEMNWDQMFSLKAQNISYHLSSQEIEYYQRLATRKFYFRPRILLRTFRRIHGFKHITSLIKRIKVVI